MNHSPPSDSSSEEKTTVDIDVTLQDDGDALSKICDGRKLLRFEEIAAWQGDNEYLLTGYRPASGSWRKTFASIAQLHNETGSLLFFTLPAYFYVTLYSQQPSATYVDALVWSSFFYGVAICFLLSATFHVSCNHSARISAFTVQLDFLGIILLMWGATIPSIYYGFFNDTTLQRVYWAIVSVLATLCTIATLNPIFGMPKFRIYRTVMYCGLGLSAIVFIVHGLIKYGWARQSRTMALPWMFAMAAFNLTGAAAYAMRFPEKWYSEKFDIYGSSHQILHVMVVFAGIAHLIGLSQAFQFVHTHIASLR